MSAFTILEDFCKVRNEKNSFYPSNEVENPITHRASFIINYLLDNRISFKLDTFNDESQRPLYQGKDLMTHKPIFKYIDVQGKYVNIEVTIKAKEETNESIMFIAHHDINNIKSDNCNDNSASVSILLQFATELKKIELDKNIHIVFTDCEEFGGRGAYQLSKKINEGAFGNVQYVVNLELTANGTELWADYNEGELIEKLLITCAENNSNLNIFKTPFNDSWILRNNNIESVCVGLLSKSEVEVVKQKGYCGTWSVCHRENDTIDQANEGEMNAFISNVLMKFL